MNSRLFGFNSRRWSLLVSICVLVGSAACSPKGSSQIAAGDKYFAGGEYEKAEIEYKNALQATDMRNVHAIGRLGLIYYEQGRLRQAFPFLLKARELQSEDLEVRNKVGLVHILTGKPNDARAEAEYILGRAPSNSTAPLLLAQASTATPADMAAAETLLKSLPGAASNSAPISTALAVLELTRKNVVAAEVLLKRALESDPKFPAAHSAMASLLFTQNKKLEGEQWLKSASEVAPARSTQAVQYARYKIQAGDLKTARTSLEALHSKAADYLPVQSLLAEIAALEKRYDESAALVAKVLAKDDAQPEAALLSARLKLARGDPSKAVEELEALLKFYPNSPQALYFLGLAYAGTGEKIKAVDRLNQAIKISPMPEAILALANINLRSGDTRSVILGLKPFVQKFPNNLQARMMLAEAYRSQGDTEAAVALYQDSAKEFPKDPQSVYRKGLVFLQSKKLTEAREAFSEALERNPGFTPAFEQLVNMDLVAENPDAALRRTEAEKARDSKSPIPYLLAGRIYALKGDAATAENEFKKAIEVRPDIPNGYYQLARLYVATKQEEKALASLRSVTDRNPKDASALLMTGLIQNELKNFPAARDAYEKVLAADSKSTVALNNLAYIYSEHLNELDRALELAQTARDLAPDEAHTADTLGWILFKKKQYARALSILEDSADGLAQSAEAQYHLGLARYMMESKDSARQALLRALELDPTLQAASKIKRRLEVLSLDPGAAAPATIETLEASLADYPDDPVAYAILGNFHEKNGDLPKALKSFEAAVAANPATASAWANLARLHSRKGDFAKALEAAKSARKLAPDDPDVGWAVGNTAHAAGDSVWAASLLQDAARKKSDEPDLLLDTSKVLYAVGQVEAARDLMAQALKAYEAASRAKPAPRLDRQAEAVAWLEMIQLGEKPDAAAGAKIEQTLAGDAKNLAALVAKAALQEQNGNKNDAAGTYEAVLNVAPAFTPAKLRYAVLAAAQNRPDSRALEWAQQARNLYPNSSEAGKALGILTFLKGEDPGRAVTLLKQAAQANPQDADATYYLGRAQIASDQPDLGRQSLQKALKMNLRADLAREAERLSKGE